MSQDSCAVPSCHGNRELGRLCAACVDKMRRWVRGLPKLYRDCEEMLTNRRTRGIERVRGGMPGGVALDEAAVAARAELLSVASAWAGLIADERPVSLRPHRAIPDLARFLLAHLCWLAGHPAAGDAVTELARVVRLAREVLEPRSAPRLELGPCEEPGCGGTLHATIGVARSGVACDNGHRMRPSEWLLLDHRLTAARPGRAGAVAGGGDLSA